MKTACRLVQYGSIQSGTRRGTNFSRTRKSTEVLRALQEIYIDVKMLGLPVSRLHADRAREFRTPAVSEWAASRDILVTRTEGTRQLKMEQQRKR